MPKIKSTATKDQAANKMKKSLSAVDKKKEKSGKADTSKVIKKNAPAAGGMKENMERKKRRYRPGTVALREIRHY